MSKSYNAKVRAVESTLNEGIKPVTVYYTNGDVEKFASLRAFCLHEELVSPKADYYGEFDSFYNGSYPSSVEDWIAVIRDNYGCTERDISYITLFDKVVVDYRDDLNEAKTKSEKVPEAKIQESIDDPLSSRTFRLSPEQVDEFDTLEIIKEKFDDRCCCIEDVTDQSRYTEGMAELMDFYVQGTGTPEIEAIYWEVRTGNSFTWKIEVNLLDEGGESLYEDILSFIEDSIEGTSINESKKKLTEYESREYPVFVQINTDKDIDKWMAPVGCDIRPDYDISDVEGSYWEIIADDEDLYRKAIAEGAVTMSELDSETDTFIFLFGNPSRLSIEGFDGYISEMGLDPEDYGVDRCDWYYDNDDAEIQLDEKKLKEAQGTKQWAANRTKFKKFGSSYFDRLYMEYSFKRDELEEETPEYDAYNSVLTLIKLASDYLNTNHESWRSSKKRQRFELYQFVNAPVEYFGLDCNNDHDGFSDEFFQACYEEGTIPFIKKYVKESELVEAINYIVNEVLNKRIGSEEHLVNKYADQQHKERAELEAKWSAQSAKFDEDTKFLQDAAKTAKVVIDVIEGYSGPDDWSVILDTEDDYEANAFRNAVGDLLEGTENAYGASYDDIPGMGDIHLGCIQYYEWSEMNGGDVYDDLDEDIREKYVVFACPKKKWIDYRRRTDW